MAVTQQLAYLSEADLIKCLHNNDAIESLLNFSLLSEDNYLDLNWEVTFLKMLISNFDDKHLEVYKNSIDGIHDFPESLGVQDVEEQPTYNKTSDVKIISMRLGEIDIDEILNKLPSSIDGINALLNSHYDEMPHKYLSDTFKELINFYKAAAEKSYAVVCWWD